MKVEQLLWENGRWQKDSALSDAGLVIGFGGKGTLDSGDRFSDLKSRYPSAHIMLCSTGGEIYNQDVLDKTVSVAAIRLDKTKLKTSTYDVSSGADSFAAGAKIATELTAPDLTNIFILSDGLNVNGSDLVRGLYSVLDSKVIVTGGLAGDAADFGTTYVGLNSAPVPKRIVAVGFYGSALKVGYGSVGGWDKFGPKRKITKAKDNVLFELDGKPALDLYKEYLGAEAEKLPGSALLFPLLVYPPEDEKNALVRTIVGIDEAAKSMIFAGDIPDGYCAQLMHGEFDNLVDGASRAAALALNKNECGSDSLALLVSCIGRKIIMGQRISDETESVFEAIGGKMPTIGFYSYGEICHQEFTGKCSLHNQTMTVTVLHEC